MLRKATDVKKTFFDYTILHMGMFGITVIKQVKLYNTLKSSETLQKWLHSES